MLRSALLLPILFSISSIAIVTGQEKPAPVTNVLVHHQFFKLSQKELTLLIFGDKIEQPAEKIKADVEKLVAQEKATLSNEFFQIGDARTTLKYQQSVEMIYTTERNPPEYLKNQYHPPTPVYYEQKPLGTNFQLQFSKPSTEYYYLFIIHSFSKQQHIGKTVWATHKSSKGLSEISMPIFSHTALKTSYPFKLGSTMLVSTFSARNEQGYIDNQHKILYFVRITKVTK